MIQGTEPGQAKRPQTPPRRLATNAFQYIGTTALTVIGPISLQRYRFASPGIVIKVDPRDQPFLANVPNLRPVRTI